MVSVTPNVEVTGATRQDGQAVRPMMNQGGSHGLAGLPWRLRLTDMLGSQPSARRAASRAWRSATRKLTMKDEALGAK
jgi:hypothetical protein